MSTITRRAQKGFTLIEALVAFGVTATGFLAVVSLQGALVTDSAYSKARSEAMSLAQQKIEEFKHYTLADEAAYIDNDGNGVMDADGNYSDPAINGQNAVFTRSWQLSSATRGRGVDVTVAWADSANRTQSVFLAAVIPWISPRSGADQLFEPSPTMLNSPTGRAELGEGELSDYPNVNPVPVSGPGPEGLRTFQNEENLLLVDQNDHVLLTLLDVCNLLTDECTDFVKISGTVYFDDANTNQPAVETYVIASADDGNRQLQILQLHLLSRRWLARQSGLRHGAELAPADRQDLPGRPDVAECLGRAGHCAPPGLPRHADADGRQCRLLRVARHQGRDAADRPRFRLHVALHDADGGIILRGLQPADDACRLELRLAVRGHADGFRLSERGQRRRRQPRLSRQLRHVAIHGGDLLPL
jgi:Tfp pilus assembly protein PilV